MSPEKAAELRKRFPFVESTCKLNFGDGWFRMLAGMCGALETQRVSGLRIHVMEKRKYGVLYVEYVTDGNAPSADRIIAVSERNSLMWCEVCGAKCRKLAIPIHCYQSAISRVCDACWELEICRKMYR
ncbi:MAG: hypothetical protein Q8L24_00770 [bacterium]|nr:hypothetical protein [bacterium]